MVTELLDGTTMANDWTIGDDEIVLCCDCELSEIGPSFIQRHFGDEVGKA